MFRPIAFVAPLALVLLAAAPPPVVAPAGETVDLQIVGRIRDEGFRRSQAMDTLRHLTDVIGPRLTGSPQGRAASDWTREQFAALGLADARLEPWTFGHGWSLQRSEVRMVAPSVAPLHAIPKAWTPGTAGPVRGAAMRAKVETIEDVEKLAGRVAGKVLLLELPQRDFRGREVKDPTEERPFERYSDEELRDLVAWDVPEGAPETPWRVRGRKVWEMTRRLNELLAAEGALATIEISSRPNGIVRVAGGGSLGRDDAPRGVAGLVMAAEAYHRLERLVDAGQPVEIEVDVETAFHEGDPVVHNTVAEIPGSDPKAGVVMAGAHLDSWHAGTGATDDAVNCAAVIEAARILQTLGVKPRRTIRFALWTGEEQGLRGSRAYVREHFADRPAVTDPAELALPESFREPTWPIQPRPEHASLVAYFNLDNGGGRVRGIHAQENVAVVPVFEAWLRPFADLGAATVTLENTGSTDHVPFDEVGLPGYQFIQDGLDYMSRTHHTEIDTVEHVHEADLKQNAVILAAFLWNAANRPEPLPRKALPQAPPAKAKPAAAEEPETAKPAGEPAPTVPGATPG